MMSLHTFDEFLLAASHHVDVLDADELQFNVRVVILILIAFSCCPIGHRIQLHTHTQNPCIMKLININVLHIKTTPGL